MKTPLWTAAGVVAAIVTIAAPGSAPAQPPAAPAERARPSLPVIDLSFPGGTVTDYVAALRKATPDANVVIAPGAGEATVPAVTLRHVTVPAALDVLRGRVRTGAGVAVEIEIVHVPSYSTDERPTYAVRAHEAGGAAGPRASTHVWTVSALLGADLTSRTLLSAIETALDVVGGSKPDVRFHEDTGLLIARGNEEQIDVITSVIDELQGARRERETEEALREALEGCLARVHALEAERDVRPAKPEAPAR